MTATTPISTAFIIIIIIIRDWLLLISDGNSAAHSFTNYIESLSILEYSTALPFVWSPIPSLLKNKGQKNHFTASNFILIYKTSSVLHCYYWYKNDCKNTTQF